MKNDTFVLEGKPFFPLGVNYIVQLQWNDTACWAAPCRNYEVPGTFRFLSRDSSLMQIKAEFALMRNMGFNSVRITSLASDLQPLEGNTGLALHSQYGTGMDTLFPLNNATMPRYLDAVDELVTLAQESGLKLVMLVRLVPGEALYEKQFAQLADRFRDRPVVMAYDLFNEPLYFDVHDRPKADVYPVVSGWQRLLKAHAPHQLSTIGLVGVPEVFAWDPNILDVDFISFHPYEYQPEQVRNELRWYGEHVDKPWIIGETSLPADNDSVPYTDQLEFARKTLAQARACGAVGYTWWQFQDVGWGRFHSDYMGVLDRTGETRVADGLPVVHGTVKPVAEAFREFRADVAPSDCPALPNYYNFSSLSAARLTGRILDEQGKPIEGGVVTGWDAGWSTSYYTISKSDGSFALYGDFPFHHWMASATRYSMVRGDVQPNTYFTDSSGTPTFFLGELRLDRISYADPKP
ncbi:MAG: cellulase family glycosylhydrolase [Flavobacteriales bacterium]|nr:cellulase family glycosylhydrolase [Flavobacteriales bacterium]